MTPTGLLQVLGSVPPGGSRTLRYDRRLYQDFYQLVAETARGESFSSQPFIMFPGARVNWSLPTNSLNVFARDGG